jgi:trans-2,3-dihydro-3-hydroxyanthranilate isomerase
MSVAELDVVRVDVFTKELHMGNPATVVFDADVLDEVLMQRMANEAGSPVTAYILRSRKADVRMRFFSPFVEEPLCGHGIIGALWCLAERKTVSAGARHRLETQVGVLPFSIEATQEGIESVWMTQTRPLFSKEGDEKEVASSIGVGVESIFTREFPLSRASTGLPFLMVATKSMEVLEKLVPKQAEITTLCRELDVAGLMAYTWSVLEPGSTVHARCFLPSPGIVEDPASGMAAGALAAYLVDNEFIPRERFDKITIEQGYFVGRPSLIRVRVEKRGGVIRKVEVGGAARVSFRGRVVTQ